MVESNITDVYYSVLQKICIIHISGGLCQVSKIVAYEAAKSNLNLLGKNYQPCNMCACMCIIAALQVVLCLHVGLSLP